MLVCVCVYAGTQGLVHVMTSNVRAIATELASCSRNEVHRLERCRGAPRL